jgi:hypothetical protein
MAAEPEYPIEERLLHVLRHLGLAQAHVAARIPGDWQGLATMHPQTITSLTLVCPQGMEPGLLSSMAPRLLVLSGERGAPAERARRVLANLPEATLYMLQGYASPSPYADLAVDRRQEIGAAMIDFLARIDQRAGLPAPGAGRRFAPGIAAPERRPIAMGTVAAATQ